MKLLLQLWALSVPLCAIAFLLLLPRQAPAKPTDTRTYTRNGKRIA